MLYCIIIVFFPLDKNIYQVKKQNRLILGYKRKRLPQSLLGDIWTVAGNLGTVFVPRISVLSR
jgi:hypothetical protein